MSLRHGARQLMDMFEADEDEALSEIALAISRLKYNPDYAIERLHKAEARILAIKQRRTQDLTAQLQKAAPPIEKRIDELEQRLAALEQPNVTKFKREA